jgi:hypothetical protein
MDSYAHKKNHGGGVDDRNPGSVPAEDNPDV